jgi:hypothetical protein
MPGIYRINSRMVLESSVRPRLNDPHLAYRQAPEHQRATMKSAAMQHAATVGTTGAFVLIAAIFAFPATPTCGRTAQPGPQYCVPMQQTADAHR